MVSPHHRFWPMLLVCLLHLSAPAFGQKADAGQNAGPTAQAAALLAEIARAESPLMAKITAHPYLAAVEAGKLPRDHFKVFAAQQYRIVSRGLQNIALLVSRFGDQPSRKSLNGFLQAEFQVIEALKTFARALGMDEIQLKQAHPLPRALTFSTYETALCLYGSDADLITAFYFDAQVWIKNAGRIGQALIEKYGFQPDDVQFFLMYADYQPSEHDVLPYLALALRRGESPHQIKEAVHLLLSYELDFWDAMADAAGL